MEWLKANKIVAIVVVVVIFAIFFATGSPDFSGFGDR